MAKQEPAEQDDPLGLENIHTLAQIEENQSSWPKTKAASENLLATGLGVLFSGLAKIITDRWFSPEKEADRMLRDIKRQGEALAEINKIEKKYLSKGDPDTS